jgi:predicted metal-dependent HD superfamily phosphohydrolase
MTQAPTPDTEGRLLERWHGLAADLGLGPGHEEVARRLLAAYSGAERHYHTDAHLAAVLTVLDELWRGPGVVPAVARAAAWFHDAVYDPRASDNEAASARLAATELGRAGAPPEDVRDVERLILSTQTHELVEVAGAPELLDADLAVLGASGRSYDAYAAAIRREYAHLDAEVYRVGRLAVLTGLLERRRLFVTATGRRLFEARARANLEREIAQLNA